MKKELGICDNFVKVSKMFFLIKKLPVLVKSINIMYVSCWMGKAHNFMQYKNHGISILFRYNSIDG